MTLDACSVALQAARLLILAYLSLLPLPLLLAEEDQLALQRNARSKGGSQLLGMLYLRTLHNPGPIGSLERL